MADTETVVAPIPVPPRVLKKFLMEGGFKRADFVTNRWSVTLDEATSYVRMLESDYWVNVARKLRIGDIIEVHAENRTWFAELYVVAQNDKAASVIELRKVDLAGTTEIEDTASPYYVKWLGPQGQWGVKRLTDNQTMQQGLASKSDAELAKAQLTKTFAA